MVTTPRKKRRPLRKRVLNNSTNSNSTKKNSTKTIVKKKVNAKNSNKNTRNEQNEKGNAATVSKEEKELVLRDGIIKFYLSPRGTALQKFCIENDFGSKVFRTRWNGSGLNDLKSKKKDAPPQPHLSVAMAKYDKWYANWQEGLRQQRVYAATSNNKRAPFTIHIDVEDDVPSNNNTTATNNARDVSKNSASVAVAAGAGAGDGDGGDTLCASHAVGKCKMESPVVFNPKAHVCYECKKPMHAICGSGERPKEVCFACYDKNNGNTNNSNDDTNKTNDDGDGDGGGDSPNSNSTDTAIPKKPRKTKLSPKEMKDILIAFYLQPDELKIGTFINQMGLISNQKAIRNHWIDSKLFEMKENSESVSYAFSKYDDWRQSENSTRCNINKDNGSQNQAIPEDVKQFMRELIKQLALCGQGLARKVVEQILAKALEDHNFFSRRTLDRFIESYKLKCKSVKNIDPVRISQVTPEKRDALFQKMDTVVQLCRRIDPDNCPWNDWASVDADCKFNIDEMSSDQTGKFRDKLLIPQEVKDRIFQATPQGDKTDRHVPVAMFSRADGKYRDKLNNIQGAPPPMIIHSKPERKEKDPSTATEKRIGLYDDSQELPEVDDRFLDGLDEYTDLGLKVFSSPNGSMTKVLFPEVCKHIIENLSPEQGENGKYTFVLMDCHVSRWNPVGLYLLFKHRVIPIFFPSHLSVVTQPQDNGVILYMHACLEDASLIPRLFALETDISYCNRVTAKAFVFFREGERRKLLTRGRNSTTRAYRHTGMHPSNPYSDGWDENLRLYASYNGMKITNTKNLFLYYCVSPKDEIACPSFSDTDIELLKKTVPVRASRNENDTSILSNPIAQCYAIADGIVNSWADMEIDERPSKPTAKTAVEKLALQHMNIAQLITAKAKSKNSIILDKYYEDKKAEAMLTSIKPREIIQVQFKDSTTKGEWFNASSMNQDDMWNVFDGDDNFTYTTAELEEKYTINTSYFMFPNDKKLISNGYKSARRRKDEKRSMLHKLAHEYGEEERDAILKEDFDKFMAKPAREQTYINFKKTLVTRIEEPSQHIVKVDFEDEEHEIMVCAHGGSTSSISSLVANTICRTIIGNTGEKEKKTKKSRRQGGSKVTRCRWGSDGIAKNYQMDEQFDRDVEVQIATTERKKKSAVAFRKKRIGSIICLQSWSKYDSIWNDGDSLLKLDEITTTQGSGKYLQHLLRIFDVKGRSNCNTKALAKTPLQKLDITRGYIDRLKTKILAELSDLGEENNPADTILDSSFADASFTTNDDSFMINTSIIDNDVDTSFPFLHDNDDEASEAEQDQYESESEISAGDESDYGSNDDDNNDDNRNRKNSGRKSVSFRRKPSVRIIPSRMKKSKHDLDCEKYNSWVGRGVTRDLSLDDDVDDNTCMEGSIKEAWMYEGSWYFEIVYEDVLDSNGSPDTEDISLSVLADTCTFHDDADNSTDNGNGNDNNKATTTNSNGNDDDDDETTTTTATITTASSPATTHHDDNNDEDDNDRSFVSDSLLAINETMTTAATITTTLSPATTHHDDNNDEDDNDRSFVSDSLLEINETMTTAATITTTLSPATTHHDDNNDDNDNDRSFILDSLLKIVTATDQKLTNVLEESSGTPIAENRDDDDYSAGTADDAGLEELQAMTADDADLEVLQTIVYNQQPTDSLDNPPGISTAVSNEDNDDDSDDSDDDSFLAPPKIKLNVGDEIEFYHEMAKHGDASSLKSSVVEGIRPDERFILNLTSGNFLPRYQLIRILPDGCWRSIDTFTLEKSGEQEWIGGQMRDTTERFKKVRAAIDNKIEIYWSNGPGQEIGDDVDKENESPTIIHDQIDHQKAQNIDKPILRRSNRRRK